ncbi:methyltransferase [Sphaerisporangium sp. NPDC005289]|uniref:methyltransferase n=1 Tax=Sphaerisporangium sp. NPDC005289 TaxID=3155247 RepID=UPI0033BDD134
MSGLPRRGRGDGQPPARHFDVSPADTIQEMIAAAWRVQALRTFVTYGCAQQFAHYGKMTAGELAARVTAVAAALEPILAALEPYGVVLRDDASGEYLLGPAGEYLLPEHPHSMLPAVEWDAVPVVEQAMEDLPATTAHGRSAVVEAAGGLYGYLELRPEHRELFDRTMAGRTSRIAPVVAQREFGDQIVDLGGGVGVLLAHILRAHPQVRGHLVERAEVAERAQKYLAAEQGIEGRWQVHGGDIFNPAHIPLGAPDYLAASILHNLTDDRAHQLLTAIGRVMAPASRLWLVDMVVPPGGEPHPGRDLGLRMLGLFGSAERRLDAYNALLTRAGLRVAERIHPLPWGLSLIVCVRDE